ncbi:CAP domain-containing protein [bacterium]|nr:CAP domain-containing protein [bacterium]
MYQFAKKILMGLMIVSFVGCSAKNMESTTGANSTSGKLSDTPVIPVEGNNPIDVTSNNLPVDASDVPNELLKLINEPAKESFLSGLFGGNGCGLLSSLLSLGASYLSGGNPLVGSLVSNLAGSLLKCGSSSSLVNLIPGGSSQSDQLFALLSQVLNVVGKGKDPTALLNAIKNPQDLNGLLNIVTTLTQQSKNPELVKILALVQNFQSTYQNSVGTCGTMNPVACQMFNLMNLVRQQNGLKPLVPNMNCTAAAQSHSKDMLTNAILSHLSSNGMTAKERLSQFGINGAWAENIIKGSSLSPEQALQMLLNSDGHKKNILNPLFTSGGIGFINGYFTQCFTI